MEVIIRSRSIKVESFKIIHAHLYYTTSTDRPIIYTGFSLYIGPLKVLIRKLYSQIKALLYCFDLYSTLDSQFGAIPLECV